MRCVKCGVPQINHNINSRSCRIHRVYDNRGCSRCNEVGNCYHEWTYFYQFWNIIHLIKLYFYRKTHKISHNDEYSIV